MSTTGGKAPRQFRVLEVDATYGNQTDFTDLSPGTYTASVRDADGCVTEETIVIADPAPLVITGITVDPVLCRGNATIIRITVTGPEVCENPPAGTLPPENVFLVSRNNGLSFGGVAGVVLPSACAGEITLLYEVTAGDYDIVVRGYNGCQSGAVAVSEVDFNEPPVLTLSLDGVTPVSCPGGDDGTLTVSYAGGTSGYRLELQRYFPQNGQSEVVETSPVLTASPGTFTFSNLTAGISPQANYRVFLTDNEVTSGQANPMTTAANMPCAAELLNIELPELAPLMIGAVEDSGLDQIECDGTNGEVTVTGVTGGTPPYQYSLTPDNFTPSNVLFPENQGGTAYVRDANGCIASATFNQQAGISDLDAIVTFPPTCERNETQVNITGGTGPYQVSLLYGESQIESSGNYPEDQITFTNLPPRFYRLEIVDAFGCLYFSDFFEVVDQPLLLVETTNKVEIDCPGDMDGSITIAISGGVPPYNIVVNGSPQASTDNLTLSGLGGGPLNFVVTDAVSCTFILQESLAEIPALELAAVATAVAPCVESANGALELTPSGGTPPYLLEWLAAPYQISLNGEAPVTTTAFSGLPDGNYAITVTDANGCPLLTDLEVTIISSGSISATAEVTDINCNGNSNGIITVNVVGAGAGAMFSLNGNAPQASNVFTGLSAGVYEVLVVSSVCQTTLSDIETTEPAALEITPTVTIDECTGIATAILAATGGTGNYTFSVEATTVDPAIPVIADPGTFTDLAVIDENGCLNNFDLIVPAFTPLDIFSVEVRDARCADGTGELFAFVTGGAPPYTYAWSGGGPNDATFPNVNAGTYTLTVTDALNCTVVSQNLTVDLIDGVIATAAVTNASCGEANGSVVINATNGTGFYFYSWEAGVDATGNQATGLLPGSYSYTVTDEGAGCFAEGTAVVGGSDAAVLTLESQTEAGCGTAALASATVAASEGLPPYTYRWSSGETGPQAAALTAGSNFVTVTTANNCATVLEVVIDQSPSPILTLEAQTEVGCLPGATASATVSATSGTGVLSYLWSDGQTGPSANGLLPGTYTVTVTDDQLCTDQLTVTIRQAENPILNLRDDFTDAGCDDQNLGSASVFVAGGLPPFTFLWSTGETTSVATMLPPGQNSVSVTDANGCTDELVITTRQTPSPELELVSQTLSGCVPGTFATATVAGSGGSGDYTYAWSSGATGPTASDLAAGMYTVTVTDEKGCTNTLTVTIGQTPPPTITISEVRRANCEPGSFGSALAFATNGSSPYTYAWSNGETTAEALSLAPGDHTVTVTDALGCTAQASVTIEQVAPPTVTVVDVACFGEATGQLTVISPDLSDDAQFTLNPGPTQFGRVFTDLAAGTYSLSVTSSNCTTTLENITISEPEALGINPVTTVAPCTGVTDIELTGTGGVPPYAYSFDGGAFSTTNQFSGDPGVDYAISMRDANGCTTTETLSIPAFTPISITSGEVTDAECEDGTGTAAVAVAGGTLPYTFAWSDGSTDSLLLGADAGAYTVEVQDANGCTVVSETLTIGLINVVTTVATTVNATCGETNGSISLTPGGGSGNYTYTWAAGVNAVGNTAVDLAGGTYSFTVTDQTTGCQAIGQASIQGEGGPEVLVASQTEAGCSATSLATATVTVSGGAAPYDYAWSNGSSGPTGTNLTAGSNFVSVTDANNCLSILEVIIEQAVSPSLSLASQTEAGCTAAALATAAVEATNGTGALAYEWSNGQTGATATDLAAGVYTVTVTDELGCTDELTVTILQSPDPVLSLVAQTEAGCGSSSIASATISASSGRAPYDFLWSNGETGATATMLTAGDNSVTVTDALGCTAELMVTIEQASSPVLTLVSQTEAGCIPSALGSATVSATGGTGSFTYVWSNGDNGPTSSGLVAGSCTVTVTDALDCTDELTVTILPAPAPVLSITDQTEAPCGPGASGSATATVTSGTTPFSYAWSNGETTAVATNLPAGDHTVTVTDAQGCTAQAAVTIDQVAVPTVEVRDVDCFGSPTGQIFIMAPGLDANVTYSLNGGVPRAGTEFSGLTPGTYELTVIASNCMTTISGIIIDEPAPLTIDQVVSIAPCTGIADIELSGNGGTPPYTYRFDGGPFVVANQFGGDPGIEYGVAVRDANGCITTGIVNLPPFTPLRISSTEVVNAECEDGTGQAAVAVVGGTPPYSFAWSNGSTDSLLTGASVGLYSVNVSDANGCLVTSAPLTVRLINVINTVANSADATCGEANGSISLSASGGSGNYTYTWEAGVVANGNLATGLAQGTYAYTVTDQTTGCQDFGQASIQGAGAPVINLEGQTLAGCTPSPEATATVTASGGQPPFTFAWSNGNSGPTGTNLAAGSNFVSVTDASGCLGILEVVIEQAPGPVLTLSSQTEAGCTIAGTATVSATGGTGALQFAWSNGETTATATNLAAGDHTVTVTDVQGCTDELMVTIIQSPDPVITLVSQTVAGCTNQASATVAVSGGTGTLSIAWSNGATSATAVNLMAGDYSVTVTDVQGCTDELSLTIEQAAELSVSLTDQTLAGCADPGFATATAVVTGGIEPYTYDWSNGETGTTATNLPPGNNTLTVTDAIGCTDEILFVVDVLEGPLLDIVSQTEAGCGFFDFGSATVAPDGGTAPYTVTWSSGETGFTAVELPAGLNFVTLTDVNNCSDIREIFIETATSPDVQVISQTLAGCGDQARATATAAASGGSPPYSFRWSSGAIGAIATDLRPGLNTVTVTDGNNCTSSLDVIIEQANAPTLSVVSQTAIGCTAGSRATASVLASGGTPPYTYAWSNGESGPTASNLLPGPSTVTVTDASECSSELTITIEQADAPVLSVLTQTTAGCGSQANATASVAVTGGQPPYSFSWSSSESGTEANNLVAGDNSVTVTDANGCSDELPIRIEQSPSPTLTVADLVPANCSEGTGAITVLAAGGTGSYTYRWSHNALLEGPEATDLFSGVYGVTITDESGCTAVLTGLRIDFNPAPELSLVSTTPSICIANSGSITLAVSGGAAPLSYAWTDNVATGLTGENLAPGDYGITVTDANGCTDMIMATVTGGGSVSLAVTSFTDASCELANGSISLMPANGVAPYTYAWSHDGTLNGPVATGLPAGTYTISLTDANGCTAQLTQAIGDSPAVTITDQTITPTSCDQNAGSVSVSVSGGTGNLTYRWNHDNMANGPTVSALPAGSYALTVTDEIGCTTTASFVVDNTDGPTLTSSDVTDALCTDGTGAISITVANGQEPYSYAWSHDSGLNSSTATNLAANNYSVTVTDANGCQLEGNFSIDFLPAPTLTLTPIAPDCDAPNSGSILPVVTGGQAPFTYAWSNTSTATSLENIPPGDYSLTITDANNCTVSATTTVEAQLVPVITLEATGNIVCAEVLGSASFLITNLTGPATFTFTDPDATLTTTDLGDGRIRVEVSGLRAGSYRLTAVTAGGCTAGSNVEITQLPPFQLVVVNRAPASCAGEASGSAEVGIIGSTETFTFQWDAATNGQTGAIASNLAAGTYQVTATSSGGCTATTSVTIGEAAPLFLTETSRMNPACFGASTGSITVAGSGGNGPYAFAWRGDTLPAFRTLTNLPAGEYEVTMTDANACQQSLTITLTEPTEILPETTVVNSNCAGSATGSITVATTGGTPPYSYNWPELPGANR